MKQRTITAFFFALAMLAGIYGFGLAGCYVLFAIIAIGCAFELMEMLLPQEEAQRSLRKILGTAIAALPVLLSAWQWGVEGRQPNTDGVVFARQLIHWTAVLVPGLLATELFLKSKTPFQFTGLSLAAMWYIGLPFVMLFSIATMNGVYAPHRILSLLLLVWTNDVGAYLIGSRFGKHKLFERISPKKTWEGTAGGAVLALLVAGAIATWQRDIPLSQWLALGAMAAVGSNVGDLVESMLKRSVGVKDSGSILPGHGGFLDRFDAFIFCLPLYWFVLLAQILPPA